jgi:hypothetical protein
VISLTVAAVRRGRRLLCASGYTRHPSPREQRSLWSQCGGSKMGEPQEITQTVAI